MTDQLMAEVFVASRLMKQNETSHLTDFSQMGPEMTLSESQRGDPRFKILKYFNFLLSVI